MAEISGDKVVRWWSVTDPTNSMGPLLDFSIEEDTLTIVTFEADNSNDEFRVIRADTKGTTGILALDASGAVAIRTNQPVRLVGDAIYQLVPSESGVDVVAFELGDSK